MADRERLTVVTSELGYVPKQLPELSDAQKAETGEFLQELDDHDDVHRVGGAEMSHWRASLLLLLLLLGAGRGWAQFDGPGSPGVSASLMRLFGTNLAFTAQVEYQLLGPDNKERIGAPMSLARLNNRIRVEVDMSRMRNREESDALAKLKPLGLDQVTSVIRPDLRATVVAFPKLRAFVKLPMPPEEADAFTKPGKMERTPIGPEKMEGRLCTKYRVVATDAQGRRHEATVWNASDLRDFPVCVATREGGHGGDALPAGAVRAARGGPV